MLVEIKISCCRMEWDIGRQGNNNTEWHNHGGDSGKRNSGVKKTGAASTTTDIIALFQ